MNKKIKKGEYLDIILRSKKTVFSTKDVALLWHPDLILLDIVMPKMDGMTMLAQLREDEWGKTARVITLTNLSDTEKVAEAIEHGSYEYLVKSDWKIEDVVAKVREKLGK